MEIKRIYLLVDEEIAGDSIDREGETIAAPGKKKKVRANYASWNTVRL